MKTTACPGLEGLTVETAELYRVPLDDPDWMQERWRRLERAEVAEAARRHLEPERL